jgi:hypothetical protein
MTQCGRLFNEFEQLDGMMKLEGVLVKTKYDKTDFNFSKVLIDFKRHLLLGSHFIIHDNIECELIPMYNVNRISLMREGGGSIRVDRLTETEAHSEPEEPFLD